MEIINTYNKSIPHQTESDHFITAVLTRGSGNNYAVYLGKGNDEWIAMHGVKCSYKEALSYFPGLEEKEYRK